MSCAQPVSSRETELIWFPVLRSAPAQLVLSVECALHSRHSSIHPSRSMTPVSRPLFSMVVARVQPRLITVLDYPDTTSFDAK